MEALFNLEPFLKSLWLVAIPTSTIFLIQTIFTFVGMDAHDGIDTHFDGDFSGAETPFQLFSFRNLINFLLGFSWGGISLYNFIDNKLLLTIVATLIGVGFVALFFVIIKQLMKLSEDNTFKMENARFKTGNVYLRIPPEKTGTGIVQVSINGTIHEMKAVTDNEAIETGAIIRVMDVSNDLLVVERM